MMRMPNREAIQALRERFPAGTTVELIRMEDDFAPPAGTRGKIIAIDDVGTVHVAWSTGSTLGLVPGVDVWKVVTDETNTIRNQILAIRDSGRTNMFDTVTVQRIAYEMDFFELVNFIEEDRKAYAHFILTGEMPIDK